MKIIVTITVKRTERTTDGACTLDFNKSYTWTEDEINAALSKKEWSGRDGMLRTKTIMKAFRDGLHLCGSEPVYTIEEIA
tara:strand:+ start:494 stop:733 length:240 start_codon:yes stop_codon:yes gene_type:complete